MPTLKNQPNRNRYENRLGCWFHRHYHHYEHYAIETSSHRKFLQILEKFPRPPEMISMAKSFHPQFLGALLGFGSRTDKLQFANLK